jgi:hypothetical protein
MECSVFILCLIQDRLHLFVLENLLHDLEGLVQQLQLDGVGLEVHLRALIIGLSHRDWRGGGDDVCLLPYNPCPILTMKNIGIRMPALWIPFYEPKTWGEVGILLVEF